MGPLKSQPYSISNFGLQISLPLIPLIQALKRNMIKDRMEILPEEDLYLALLNVSYDTNSIAAIILKRLESQTRLKTRTTQFARVLARLPISVKRGIEKVCDISVGLIYVRQKIILPPPHRTPRILGFQVFVDRKYCNWKFRGIVGNWWSEDQGPDSGKLFRVRTDGDWAFGIITLQSSESERAFHPTLFLLFGWRDAHKELVGIVTDLEPSDEDLAGLSTAIDLGR